MTRHTVAVIVEWDNVRLSELDRARRMLSLLVTEAAQVRVPPPWATPEEAAFLAGVARPIEVIVTFDSTQFSEAELRAVVDACLPPTSEAIALRTLPVPGARYYALKNAGAAASSGDFIVFLDSDAVPEPGWLAALLAGFADPARGVIGGNTHIEPVGIYGKSFALTWFFPPRSEDGPPVPVGSFLANNVAFRRHTFLPTGFELEEGLSKGACVRLARRLRDAGIGIWRSPRARCSHPPPNGLAHFVTRAIAEGRDNALGPTDMALTPAASVRRLVRNQRSAASRILRGRREGVLTTREVPVSLAIAASYYGFLFLGEVMSHAAPGWMRRRFQL